MVAEKAQKLSGEKIGSSTQTTRYYCGDLDAAAAGLQLAQAHLERRKRARELNQEIKKRAKKAKSLRKQELKQKEEKYRSKKGGASASAAKKARNAEESAGFGATGGMRRPAAAQTRHLSIASVDRISDGSCARVAVGQAVSFPDHDVLDLMANELTNAGDYSTAADTLQVMASKPLSDAELADASLVRSKLHDLVKLGEMRWRYRVCEEGESPRDEGLKVLEGARDVLQAHLDALGLPEAERVVF